MAALNAPPAMETSIKPSATVSSTSVPVNPQLHDSRHRTKSKKGSDPFLELTDADLDLSKLTSPKNVLEHEAPHSDSIIADVLHPTSASSTRFTDIHTATSNATDYDLVSDLAIPC